MSGFNNTLLQRPRRTITGNDGSVTLAKVSNEDDWQDLYAVVIRLFDAQGNCHIFRTMGAESYDVASYRARNIAEKLALNLH
mgnify:FL=1